MDLVASRELARTNWNYFSWVRSRCIFGMGKRRCAGWVMTSTKLVLVFVSWEGWRRFLSWPAIARYTRSCKTWYGIYTQLYSPDCTVYTALAAAGGNHLRLSRRAINRTASPIIVCVKNANKRVRDQPVQTVNLSDDWRWIVGETSRQRYYQGIDLSSWRRCGARM